MAKKIMHLRFILIFSFVASLVTACGGGGSSAISPGSNANSNSITLDLQSLVLVQEKPRSSTEMQPATADVTATFRGAGVVVGTLPGEALPFWLAVRAPQTSASPLKIRIEGLADKPGKFQSTLRFATGDADLTGVVTQDLPITLLVLPKVDPELSLDGVAQGAPVKAALLIDSGNASFALSSDVEWLRIDNPTVSGTANIGLTADPKTLSVGVHTATIKLEETVTRSSKVVKVYFRIDTPQLLVRQRGVALSLVGAESRLSTSIIISDNGKPGLQWTAVGDKPWLKLGQQRGVTGGMLSLSADPATLVDGMNYATVTLKQESSLSAPPITVRVGVYLSRAAQYSAVASAVPPSGLVGMSTTVLADPLRPYFYFMEAEGTLGIYNMYTGVREGNIQIPTWKAISMTASYDGSRLFVLDALGFVFPVDLDKRAAGTPISIGPGTFSSDMRIAYAELNGLPVLATNEVRVIDLRTGATLAKAQRRWPDFPALVVQRDGKAMFMQTGSGGNHSLSRYSLANFQGTVLIGALLERTEPGDGTGLALDFGDTYLYSAFGALPGEVANRYDTATMTLSGNLRSQRNSVSGIAVSPSGSVFISNWVDSNLITYGADLVPLGSNHFGQHIDAVDISGDGRRLALRTQEGGRYVIYFVAVP